MEPFICRELLNSLDIDILKIKILLDNHHKFISIEYQNLRFLDSCRLSGGQSLKNICKIWKVDSPKLESKELWFQKEILLEENKEEYLKLLRYAQIDSLSLYQFIYKATLHYRTLFDIDFLSKVSTASLNYKIWSQTIGLKGRNIALPLITDKFTRAGDYGGYTNYFKFAGQNLHHYDVNSLYPYAMLNEMPVEIIDEFSLEDKKPKLETFFGFAYAKITNPTNLELLPIRIGKLRYLTYSPSWGCGKDIILVKN